MCVAAGTPHRARAPSQGRKFSNTRDRGQTLSNQPLWQSCVTIHGRRWGRPDKGPPAPGRVAKPGGAKTKGRRLGRIQRGIQSHRPETSGLLTGEAHSAQSLPEGHDHFLNSARGFLSGHPKPGKTKDLGSRGTFSGASTSYFWGGGGGGRYCLTRHLFLAPLSMPKPFLSPPLSKPWPERPG